MRAASLWTPSTLQLLAFVLWRAGWLCARERARDLLQQPS
jgi:hypothetical protein